MARPRWKRLLIVLFKAAIALLVLWGVGRQMLRTWSDLQHRELAIEPRPIFLLLSGVVYVAGLSCCAFFYENILSASTTPIASLPAYRAYLVSHLGKYVPGKAMVVVMRAGMSAEHGARGATAAIATFYETLVMMAAGGLIAALGFALGGPSPSMAVTLPALGRITMPFYRLAGLFAMGLGLAFLVVVLPPCFRRLALMVSLPLPGVGPEVLPRFSAGLLARGLRARRRVVALPRPQSDPCCARAGAAGSVRFPGHGSRGRRERGTGHRGRLRGSGAAGRTGGTRGRAHGRRWARCSVKISPL